jgi:5-methylcytosine-specific restriction endonuclease McrA
VSDKPRRRRTTDGMTPEAAREYRRQEYLRNGVKKRAAVRAYYHKNKKRIGAMYLAEREKRLARQRERRDGKDGDAMRAAARRRYAANPGPFIARANKRRRIAMKAAAGTDRVAYAAFVTEVRTAHKYDCHWCGKNVNRFDRRIDHIVPLSRGGLDSVQNLCCACEPCNSKKADKLPLVWLSEIGPR